MVVTANFFCFLADGHRGVSLVLPLSRVQSIAAARAFIGLLNNGFVIHTQLEKFSFTTLPGARAQHLRTLETQLSSYRGAHAQLDSTRVTTVEDRLGRRRWAAVTGVGDEQFQQNQRDLEEQWLAIRRHYFIIHMYGCVCAGRLILFRMALRMICAYCDVTARCCDWRVLAVRMSCVLLFGR